MYETRLVQGQICHLRSYQLLPLVKDDFLFRYGSTFQSAVTRHLCQSAEQSAEEA